MAKIKTAVFPVAGLGTRFLPITKASPKEMLTMIDRPLIDYAVQEAVAAGVKQLVFVTSGTKRAIEDYFDTNYELEHRLQHKNKLDMLDELRSLLPADVQCVYLRQAEPKGLGDAILTARDVVDGEPFAVLLADDLVMPAAGAQPCLQEMVADFARQPDLAALLGVTTITPQQAPQYGVVAPSAGNDTATCFGVDAVVEKPQPEQAPSTFGVVGRYILTPAVFDYLAQGQVGAGGEVQLTDAISALLPDYKVAAHPIRGTRYDCGSKLGYLEAVLAYASVHPHLGDDFRKSLAKYAQNNTASISKV